MSPEEAFQIWAPAASPWSPWAKPVCFSQKIAILGTSPPPDAAAPWNSLPCEHFPAASGVALVIDLPGSVAANYGIALAARGYRPVPLFNACSGPAELVPIQPIVLGLWEGAAQLPTFQLPDDAPPAFLLDANRSQGALEVRPGRFDNRSLVFPQDFPSARFLQSQGIQRVVVAQGENAALAQDLAHVLLRWQEAGLPIERLDPLLGQPSQPLHVTRPSGFRGVMYRMLTMLGMRRNSAGGFGGLVPHPSQG